jgi:phosphohistidine phosphatase
MKLYLVQHAKAAPKEIDPERALTDQGCQELRKIVAFVKPLNLSVDYFWHSGKKRAAQTAQLLAEVIKKKKDQAVRDDLGPTDDVTGISNELAHIEQDVMIVGHLPFLSKLTSVLLTGSESAGTVAFKNAGIVCLSRSAENRWQLNWVLIPELLAAT